ncbi:MAG: hypothetical protein HGA97_06010 [Chlorobiaceae bacterium]|nr:hypothetical protein [Chlorobiaceae bacterium]
MSYSPPVHLTGRSQYKAETGEAHNKLCFLPGNAHQPSRQRQEAVTALTIKIGIGIPTSIAETLIGRARQSCKRL